MDAIYNQWFLAVFIRQSSSKKRKIFEKSKKSKNTVKRMFTSELRITLSVCVCVWITFACCCVWSYI